MIWRRVAWAWVGIWALVGLAACGGTQRGEGPSADVGGVGAVGGVGVVAGTEVAPMDGARVFVPGPWVRTLSVRKASSQRALEQERRTASEVGADGRWTVRFERTPIGRTDWRLERTLTLEKTGDGVALVKLEDATRELVYEFEPSLVLAPTVVAGRYEAKAKATQGGDIGDASATITQIATEDGLARVRTTLTLVQGRTRIDRVSELTLGEHGSVRERNERTVRWGRIRVDHADEVLEEVGE